MLVMYVSLKNTICTLVLIKFPICEKYINILYYKQLVFNAKLTFARLLKCRESAE